MSGRFITTKNKKRKGKMLFFFLMFVFGMISTFKYLDNNVKKVNDKEFVEIILGDNFNNSLLDEVFNFRKYIKPINLLMDKYNNVLEKDTEVEEVINVSEPVIYIYNSHQTEEYAASDFVEFSVRPTVMMVDYILEDVFNNNKYKTIVEERSIKEILNQNNWKYNNSYKASRILMEDAFSKNSSLKYFIDIHRDSLDSSKTTVNINGKDFAKTIFLIGLENENYLANLEFTERINNKMNEKYPGLSKGIYKKSGPLVNGIYNQDFSSFTILLEVGGFESTTTEVLNSSLAFAECFLEVIRTYYE